MIGYPDIAEEEWDVPGLPLTERSLTTDVVRSGKRIEYDYVEDYVKAYPNRADMSLKTGAGAIVGWPLSSGGEPFGALILFWSDEQPLDPAHRAYISAVATMVSQALVRAKIYADEHARAAVLRAVAQPEARVQVAGLEYDALYRPADAGGLGGDWYSVLALPDGKTYLSIGDVMGHGLATVEDMAQMRSSGNAYANMGLSAAQLLTELNRFASQHIDGEFATNLVAIFDPNWSSLTYSPAAHLPALLRRAATAEVVRLDQAQGPLLGPFEDSGYVQVVVPVSPGDVLIMYSDGLVEHHDQDLRVGIAHLEEAMATWPPEALLDCAALAEQVAPSPHTDDLCLLAVRFGPAGVGN